MSEDMTNERLEMLGYRAIRTPLPGGNRLAAIQSISRSSAVYAATSHRFDEVHRLCGLLSNVDYMRAALDHTDRMIEAIPDTVIDRAGAEQFAHLGSTPELNPIALIYIAIRRFQRKQDYPRMRAALKLLSEYRGEADEMTDAVALIYSLSPEMTAMDKANALHGGNPPVFAIEADQSN